MDIRIKQRYKRQISLLFVIYSLLFSVALSSCSDFFDSDLTDVTPIDGRTVQQERDAFYQMNGILQLLQQVGDDYIIAGELRGDLMSQTVNSSQDLRDIEFFQADSTNSYLAERKLYALVNNCNYLIASLDRDYMGLKADTLASQAKCLRAWAFLQLALDYGKVHYYTNPILADGQTATNVQELTLLPLLSCLVSDLLPYLPADGEHERLPFEEGEYSSIGGYATRQLFIPVRYMLGELYMWQENFYEAAHMYYQLMLDRQLTVPSLRNRWRNNLCQEVSTRTWDGQFASLTTSNQVAVIPFSSDFATGKTRLPALFDTDYQLSASSQCLRTFTEQQFTINLLAVPVSGDLRGEGLTTDFGSYVMRRAATDDDEATEAHITKLRKMRASDAYYIPLARAAGIYLRYAEAVNRLGLHRLAFAVLKYGLNATTLQNTNYIGQLDVAQYPFADFGQQNRNLEATFAANAPLHSRGSGDADMNSSFAIDTSTGLDSLTDVENKIMTEYVLECAFEGSRFHDLMRISQYRRSPQYLAATVARKLAAVPGSPRSAEAWTQYLSDERNWYLPALPR